MPDSTTASCGGRAIRWEGPAVPFIYKGITLSDDVGPFVRLMPTVNDHRETLRALQGSWDALSLLGQLSNLRIDMTRTRAAFDGLTGELMASLAEETLTRATSGLGYKAQVAVDILTRNLFERTADIGFFATDTQIVAAVAGGDRAALDALPARFSRYVSRYSVYRDVVLLDTSGQVLCRMNEGFSGRSSSHIVKRALAARGFVETYAPTDFCGGPALTYACVVGTGSPSAVLVLDFDLVDEARRIFERLAGSEDLLAFVDMRGRIVLSNDPIRLPAGGKAPLPASACAHVRLLGQTYVAVQRQPQPYQGYAGPGWSAVALVPAEVAFEERAATTQVAFTGDGIFSQRMRAIPAQASAIQGDLDRAVWNGRLLQNDKARDDFSRALLAEIAGTGRRTKGVFEAATRELLDTATGTILQEAQFLSGLAVDIFDRNLYERACDCRWWTENAALASLDAAAGARVLAHINSLYTVYTEILLFDAAGRVVAASRTPALVGQVLADPWVKACLANTGQAGYAVSAFAPTELYAGEATYVYAAPIVSRGRTVGGVGLVFDAAPQLRDMLKAALPTRAGSMAAFLRPDGSPLSGTARLPFQLPKKALALRSGESWSGMLVGEGHCFAVGATASSGYREFKVTDRHVDDVISVIAVPCGELDTGRQARALALAAFPGGREIATFHIGAQAAGVFVEDVVECIEVSKSVRVHGDRASRVRHCGFTPWREQALPLVDVSEGLGEPGAAHRHAIVLEHDGLHFGLLVSELGAIVALDIPPTMSRAALCGDHQLIAHIAKSGSELVPILSSGCIAEMSVAVASRAHGAGAA
jgi:chemotaxis signal transduction protein